MTPGWVTKFFTKPGRRSSTGTPVAHTSRVDLARGSSSSRLPKKQSSRLTVHESPPPMPLLQPHLSTLEARPAANTVLRALYLQAGRARLITLNFGGCVFYIDARTIASPLS